MTFKYKKSKAKEGDVMYVKYGIFWKIFIMLIKENWILQQELLKYTFSEGNVICSRANCYER